MSDKTHWTTRELADEATRRGRPITQERIRQLCKSGVIRATKPGHDWLIPNHVAMRWLERWLQD